MMERTGEGSIGTEGHLQTVVRVMLTGAETQRGGVTVGAKLR